MKYAVELYLPRLGAAALPGAAERARSEAARVSRVGFEPASVTVHAGDAVHWTNRSAQKATVTGDDSLFDSGALRPGAGFSIALAVPGEHTYRSTNDPSMRGRVIVALDGLTGPP